MQTHGLAIALLCAALIPALAWASSKDANDANPSNDDAIAELRHELEAVRRQNQQMQQQVELLRDEVESARDEAQAARVRLDSLPDVPQGGSDDALWSTPLGQGARLQLLDVSVDVLTAVGASSVQDEYLELLQAGDHDPRRRGFNVPSIELSFLGAIDPYLRGEVHLLYFLDPEGESNFEIEEAFAQTQRLPWGLEEQGLQLEFGQMLTEFGRSNPRHVHAWHWQDQPVIASRFFGEDGMRNPGVRASWLMPLPWFAELHLGAQNAQGETMVSFLASDEVFDDRPIGGRPFDSAGTRSVSDLVYLMRLVNAFDFSDTWTGQLGLSAVTGPNATGSDATTWIYGMDLTLKWRPLSTDRGWPFVSVEAELMKRDYEADSFFGCPGDEDECDDPISLGSDTLKDWGGYAQVLWGFRRGWSAGLRYEYATGSGGDVGEYASRSDDPFRDDRHRVSPLLVFHPSEFSRLRFQYNYDRAQFLDDDDAHTVWLGLEFLFGQHPAHSF